MKSIVNKIPWGILTGVCLVIVFYTVVGTVAAAIILNAVTSIVDGAVGLFGTWYQKLLFVCDIVFGIGFIGSATMYILNKFNAKRTKEANNQ